jgi:uncharacterized protein (DUF983 family)
MKTEYFFRTLRNRCPRCNKGAVLGTLFQRHEKCSSCALEYSREDGFFIGGIPISYGLICGIWIVPILAFWFFDWISTDWMIGLCLGGAIGLPVLTYRYSQCLWLGLYFTFAEHEMPVVDKIGKRSD